MSHKHLLNAILRTDPYAFMKHFFPLMFPGEAFEEAPHLQAIALQIKRIMDGQEIRLVVNQPPRSLKSYAFSVILPALYLGHHPERRIVCVSYSEELAAKLSRDCKKIMQSDKYRELFSGTLMGKKNTEMEYETTRGGGRLALAMGGAITGRGADMIVIDDPVKPEDMKSALERQRFKDIIGGTLYSRLNSKETGIIVMVMQRLHADDPTAHLIEKGGYTHISFPAIASEDLTVQVSQHKHIIRPAGSVLLPGRENLETLLRLKTDMGSHYFEAQYQQNPVPEGGITFKKEWFCSIAPEAWPALPGFHNMVTSWDLANKPDVTNDYSVGTVWGIYKTRYYLLDVIRLRLPYPELKKRIVATWGIYRRGTTLIEDEGIGTAMIQELKASTQMAIIPYKPKVDKQTRAQQASAAFEAGKVILPVDAPWKAEYVSELLAFSNGKYDDQVDSTTQFINWQTQKKEKIFVAPEAPKQFYAPPRDYW